MVFPAAMTSLRSNGTSAARSRTFHAAALAQGAADDGEPEYCAEYGANYFAAFVEDPDGYRLEAKALATGTGVL
jgi:hypothetical protein